MKSNVKSLMILILPILCVFSCEQDPSHKTTTFKGKITHMSDCKSNKSAEDIIMPTPDSVTCINYAYDESKNELTVVHINTAFNCCPDTVAADFTMSNDTLTIEEKESASLCNCDCLYDLSILIQGVEKKAYYLKVIEPYSGDQQKLEFEVDLVNNPNGSFCLTRHQYPW
jgi:hypothetical protein